MAEKSKEVRLNVVEALQDDAYKGIARLDAEVMRELGVRRGDVIIIKGNRETVAIADRAYPADVGEGILRIDGILRRNAKASIGDIVSIRKAEVKEAKKVMIAPAAQKGIVVQADSESLKRGLLGRSVVKGDILVLGGVQRRKDLFSEMGFGEGFGEMFGEELNNVLGNFGGGVAQIKFMVVNVNPNTPVIITENTELTFSAEEIEITDEKIPEITYEDIGGLTEEIKKIREMVEIPIKHPEIFQKLGVEAPKGVLLHGPPGTGKTLLAKAVANESDANFILLNGPEIMSKFYGESEKKIRDIFEKAEKTAPSIVFIDEIDAIAPKREEVSGEVERRVVSQILTMMDGLKSRGKVIVIGATNRLNALDSALRRPGRFDREIEVGVPDKAGRLSILKIHTRGMPLDHWDPKIAKDKLLKRLDLFEGDSSEKISSIEINLSHNEDLIIEKEQTEKKLTKELSSIKKIIPQLGKEIGMLDLEYHSGNKEAYSLLMRKNEKYKELCGTVERLESTIAEINLELEDLDYSCKQLKEDLITIKKNLDTINKRQAEIKKNKKFLDYLLKDIESLRNSIGSRGSRDPRSLLLKNNLAEKDKLYSSILEDLINNAIISLDLLEEIRRESIPLMLADLAGPTHGFVGADLEALTKESAMNVIRKYLPQMKLDEEEQIPQEVLEKLIIHHKDFLEALKSVRPSAMREVLVETPNVTWDSIGGLENVKQELKEAVEWPLKFPESFKNIGIRPSRGILLYGPSGTGKTLLAKAVAKESEANFIQIKGPELLSKWVGESEEGVRKIFERARQVAPCVIFFDEVDSLAGKRGQDTGNKVTERVLNQLLAEMDGLEDLNDVLIIGATNRPDMLDTALLRPGRFDKILLVNAPEEKGRLMTFKIHTKNMPLEKDVDLNNLAKITDGYTGADIEAVVREAGMLALREDITTKIVKKKHFEQALEKTKPSVNKSTIQVYKKIEDTYLKTAKASLPAESYLG